MSNKLMVLGQEVKVVKKGTEDFMSLTGIYNSYGKETGKNLETFIRSSEILEFLGEWESKNNPDFKSTLVHDIVNEAKVRTNLMSYTRWTEQTSAIGVYSIKGRYGGVYAHATIALRFCAYLSKKLEVTVYEDYLTYKKLEFAAQRSQFRQDVADDFKVMCVMIDTEYKSTLSEYKQKCVYSDEADMINIITFGMKASEWRKKYPHLVVKGRNQRDYCTPAQLECVKKLQTKNTMLLEMGITDVEVRKKSLIKQRDLILPHLNKSRGTTTNFPLSDLE